MSEPIQKFIYFPDRYDKRQEPYLIYVNEYTGDELVGSDNLKDVEQGRFAFYPRNRCQAHSVELWDACMKWISRRDLLESDYQKLMRKGVR